MNSVDCCVEQTDKPATSGHKGNPCKFFYMHRFSAAVTKSFKHGPEGGGVIEQAAGTNMVRALIE